MKKTIFTIALGFSSVIMMSGNYILAQNSKKDFGPDLKKNFLPSLHSLAILQNPDLTDAQLLTRNEINIWVVRDFLNRFEKVENVLWFAIPKGGYEAYFVQDGFGDRVLYDKSGGWQASLLTYDEDKCDRDIRAAVKSAFFDYDIFLVRELHTVEGVEHIFYMEDKSSVRIVRVTKAGELEILQEFDK
ncbi:MAG TPA: hypothetical protein VGI38_04605 [Puia sp.]|jgi:hypothetical protein